jgi:hypothetical protein
MNFKEYALNEQGIVEATAIFADGDLFDIRSTTKAIKLVSNAIEMGMKKKVSYMDAEKYLKTIKTTKPKDFKDALKLLKSKKDNDAYDELGLKVDYLAEAELSEASKLPSVADVKKIW